jgi:tetratricopeptide (TPR) repeat protein
METVGSRIRRFRIARGLTQEQLGAPRYTHAHVSTVESGRRRPSHDALEHFASKLEVTVDELETGRSPALRAGLHLELEDVRRSIASGDLDRAESQLEGVGRAEGFEAHGDLFARATELRALIAEQRGRSDEALELYEKAQMAHEKVSLPDAAYALAGQLRCHRALGDLSYSIYLGERFLARLRAEGLEAPDAVARVLSPLVLAYFETGAERAAQEGAARLERLARRVNDPLELAPVYLNVAHMQVERGEYEAAERSLLEAERLFRDHQRPNEVGVALLAQGIALARAGANQEALARAGANQEARARLREASNVLTAANNPIQSANALLELGRLERKRGNSNQALEHLDRSLKMLGDKDAGFAAWGHREKARCLISVDASLAEKSINRAIEIYERIDQPNELAISYVVLGRVQQALSNPRAACQSFEVAASIIDSDR